MTNPPTSDRTKHRAAGAAIACALIAPCEGLRLYVYSDPVGIPTYCFGETRNPTPGKQYTLQECQSLLDDRALEAITTVDTCVPGLPPKVLGAFGSAVYNMGPTIACNTAKSTAARYLHDGKLVDACNQLPRWNTAAGIALPGLTKRRALERIECLEGTT